MGGRWRLLVLAAAMFALVSGCSGGGQDGTGVASIKDAQKPAGDGKPQDGGTDEDRLRAYAKCMRDHGIDMPDPQTNGSGGGGFNLGSEDGEKMTKADTECKHLLPNGGEPQPLDAQQLDRMREQAKCLREHGIDVPDPDPNKPGLNLNPDEDHEKVNKAFEACLGGDGPGVVRIEEGEPPK